MTVSVTVCGSAAYSLPATATGVNLTTPVSSIQVPVTNVSGDWMVAVVAWTQPSYVTGAGSVSFADDGNGSGQGNWWEPLGAPGGTSAPSATSRVSAWIAPAGRAVTFVTVAPASDVQDLCVTILDVAGLQPWYALTGITTAVSSSGTVTATLGAPPASAFLITGVSTLTSSAPTQTAGGWTAVAATGPTTGGASVGLELNVSWQVASTAVTSTWTSGSSFMAEILGGFLVSAPAPAQPNLLWPATVAELAPGAGAQTSPDAVSWVNCTSRYLGLSVTQGRQYQLAQLQAGQGTLTLDNPDGALLPPGTGAFTGITAGTPFRVRCAWAGGAWQVQFSGDGIHGGPGITSASGSLSTGGFATPGKTYSFSAWLACSAPYMSGVTLQMDFYNGSLTLLGQVMSVAVTGTTATLTVVTGTAPAGTVFMNVQVIALGFPASSLVFTAASGPPIPQANLIMSGASSWNSNGVIGVTVTRLAAWAPDVRGAPVNTPWSVPFSGYVLGWPQAWDANLRGVVQAPVTDAFGMLTANLNPILQQEILNDAPYAYWPCTDAAGETQAANMSGGFNTTQGTGNANPLVLQSSKYGVGGATEAFGQNGSAILGAQGTINLTSSVRVASQAGMWGQALPVSAYGALEGFSLTCTDRSLPQLASGITIEAWFQLSGFEPANPAQVFTLGGPSSFLLTIAPNVLVGGIAAGNMILSYTPPGGPVTQVRVSATSFNAFGAATVSNQATGPLTHVALTSNATTWTVYLNGVQSATGSYSSAMTSAYTWISIGGLNMALAGNNFSGFSQATSGFFGHVAVYPRMLTATRINTHYQAGALGMAGDATSTRLERLLQATPYLGRRCIIQETGGFVTEHVSCQDIGGQPASQSIANISANVVPGNFWNAPNGDLRYQAREYTWDQAARWVLGDSPALGEITYLGSITFPYDTQRVLNSIQLTQLDNQDIITPSGPQTTLVVQASQQQYGSLAYWVTGYLEGDLFTAYNFGPGLPDLANWIANTQNQPFLRAGQGLAVDSASQPSAWMFLLSAAPGDPVTVNRRPQGWGGQVVTVAGRISQVQRQLSYGSGGISAQLTLLIDMMPEGQGLLADDPARGQLTGSYRLGW